MFHLANFEIQKVPTTQPPPREEKGNGSGLGTAIVGAGIAGGITEREDRGKLDAINSKETQIQKQRDRKIKEGVDPVDAQAEAGAKRQNVRKNNGFDEDLSKDPRDRFMFQNKDGKPFLSKKALRNAGIVGVGIIGANTLLGD